MRLTIGISVTVMSVLLTSVCMAQPNIQPRPEIFTQLLDCRALTDNVARLACFDRQVAALDTAAKDDEVVILDKQEIKKTRRSLFGFNLPRLPFLGSSDADAKTAKPEDARIESTLASVRPQANRLWLLTLEDGAQWQTTEPIPYEIPVAGMKVAIRKAAMGSFLGNINGWRAVRMKRVG